MNLIFLDIFILFGYVFIGNKADKAGMISQIANRKSGNPSYTDFKFQKFKPIIKQNQFALSFNHQMKLQRGEGENSKEVEENIEIFIGLFTLPSITSDPKSAEISINSIIETIQESIIEPIKEIIKNSNLVFAENTFAFLNKDDDQCQGQIKELINEINQKLKSINHGPVDTSCTGKSNFLTNTFFFEFLLNVSNLNLSINDRKKQSIPLDLTLPNTIASKIQIFNGTSTTSMLDLTYPMSLRNYELEREAINTFHKQIEEQANQKIQDLKEVKRIRDLSAETSKFPEANKKLPPTKEQQNYQDVIKKELELLKNKHISKDIDFEALEKDLNAKSALFSKAESEKSLSAEQAMEYKKIKKDLDVLKNVKNPESSKKIKKDLDALKKNYNSKDLDNKILELEKLEKIIIESQKSKDDLLKKISLKFQKIGKPSSGPYKFITFEESDVDHIKSHICQRSILMQESLKKLKGNIDSKKFDQRNLDYTIPDRDHGYKIEFNVEQKVKSIPLNWNTFKILTPNGETKEFSCIPGSEFYNESLIKLKNRMKTKIKDLNSPNDAHDGFHFFIRYSGKDSQSTTESKHHNGVIYLDHYKTKNHGGVNVLHEYLASKAGICDILKPSTIYLNERYKYEGSIVETIKNIQNFMKNDNAEFSENPTKIKDWIASNPMEQGGINEISVLPDEFPLPDSHNIQDFSIFLSVSKTFPGMNDGIKCSDYVSSNEKSKPVASSTLSKPQKPTALTFPIPHPSGKVPLPPSPEAKELKTPILNFTLKIKNMATVMKFYIPEFNDPLSLPTIETVRTDILNALNSSDQLKDGMLVVYKPFESKKTFTDNASTSANPKPKTKIEIISSSSLTKLKEDLEKKLVNYKMDKNVESTCTDEIINYKFNLDFNQSELVANFSNGITKSFDLESNVAGVASEINKSPDPFNANYFRIVYQHQKPNPNQSQSQNFLILSKFTNSLPPNNFDSIDILRSLCKIAAKRSYLVHGYFDQIGSLKYSGEIKEFVNEAISNLINEYKFNGFESQGVLDEKSKPFPKEVDLSLERVNFQILNEKNGIDMNIFYDCMFERTTANDINSELLNPPPISSAPNDTTKGAIVYQLQFKTNCSIGNISVGIGIFQAHELSNAEKTFKEIVCPVIETSNHVSIKKNKAFTQTFVNNLPFTLVKGDFENLIKEINDKIIEESSDSSNNIGSVKSCPTDLDCSDYERMKVSGLDDSHFPKNIQNINVTSFYLKFEGYNKEIKCDNLQDKDFGEGVKEDHESKVEKYGFESLSKAIITFEGKELLNPRLTLKQRDLSLKFQIVIDEKKSPITFQDFTNQICQKIWNSEYVEQGYSYGYIPFDVDGVNQDSYIGPIKFVKEDLETLLKSFHKGDWESLPISISENSESTGLDVENISPAKAIQSVKSETSLPSSEGDESIPPPPEGDGPPLAPPMGNTVTSSISNVPSSSSSMNNDDGPPEAPPMDDKSSPPSPPPMSDGPPNAPSMDGDDGPPPPPPMDGDGPPNAPSMNTSSGASTKKSFVINPPTPKLITIETPESLLEKLKNQMEKEFPRMPKESIQLSHLRKLYEKTKFQKNRIGISIPRQILFEMNKFHIEYQLGNVRKSFPDDKFPQKDFYVCSDNNSDLNHIGKGVHYVNREKSIEYLAVDTEIANKRAYLALNQNNLIFRNYESDKLERLFLNYNQFQQTFNDQIQNQRNATLDNFENHVSSKHKNLKKLGNKVKGQTNILKTEFEQLKSMKESFEEHLKEFSFAAMDWEATYKGSNEKVVIEESTVSSLVKKAIKTAKESGMRYEQLWDYMEKISEKEKESRRLLTL